MIQRRLPTLEVRSNIYINLVSNIYLDQKMGKHGNRYIVEMSVFIVILMLLAGFNFSVGYVITHGYPVDQLVRAQGTIPGENTSLLAANAFNSQKNDSLSAGGDLYLYVVATGGASGISGENFTPDANLTNSAGSSSVVVIGHSLSSSTSFSTSAGSYTIGEAKVLGGITEAYTYENNSSGAGSVKGNFYVQNNGSLVVIAAATSSEYSISLSSNTNFNVSFKQGTTYSYIFLGYQYLREGKYNFTAKTLATSGSSKSLMSIGVVVYIFSPVNVSALLHMTLFSMANLPPGMEWNISYAGLSKSSNYSIIWFQTPNGTYNWRTSAVYYKGNYDERALVNRTNGINIVDGKNIITELGIRVVQFWINIMVGGGNGKVKPDSGWFNQSSTMWISAFPNPGYYVRWVGQGDGNYTGPNNEGELSVLSQINETAIFGVEKYEELFTESGLPVGTAWWVNLSGAGNFSTTGASIMFYVPNGTYYFKDGSLGFNSSLPDGYLNVSGGQIDGTNLTNVTSIGFQKKASEKFYNVTFHETGLLQGTKWYATVNQTTESSEGTIVSIQIINGTYTFTLGSPGYVTNISSGSLIVNGKPSNIYLKFTRTVFVLSENESGFPGLSNGSAWEISLNGTDYYSTTSGMNITLPNGSYVYSVYAPLYSQHLWYILPNESGQLRGHGAEVYMNTTFIDSYSWSSSISMGYPYVGTYDPFNGLVYIANYSTSSSGEDNVVVVNGNVVTDVISIGYSYPYGITCDPLNGLVYVANYGSSDITVINGTEIVKEIPVEYNPYYITNDPVNGYIYVANYGTSTITIISNLSIIGTVNVGEDPSAVAVDTENGYVYVGTLYGYIYVMYGSETMATINAGYEIYSMAYDPSNGLVYAVLYGSNSVMILRGASIVTNITVGSEPVYVVYDAANGLIYVANSGSDNLTVIDGLGVIMQIPTGNDPTSIIPDLSSGKLYIANYNSNSLSVVAFPTETFIAELDYSNGSQWGLKIVGRFVSNVTQYSFSSTIVFTLINCTYSYSVVAPGYHALSSQESFSAESTNTTNILRFSLSTYMVTFDENGLPAGNIWYVNLSNGQSFSSSNGTVTFSEPNGTYSFILSTADKNFTPLGDGSFIVNGGSPNTINVTFDPVKFKVTFNEKGLSQGTVWYLNMTGLTSAVAVNSSSYTFFLSNGSYKYKVSTANHSYRPQSYNQIVTVNGSNVSVYLSFEPVTFEVTFMENGLKGSYLWSVTIAGKTFTSNTSSILIYLTNGTYYYQIMAGGGSSISNYQGMVRINGTSANISLSFVQSSTIQSSIASLLPYVISIASLAVAFFVLVTLRRRTP